MSATNRRSPRIISWGGVCVFANQAPACEIERADGDAKALKKRLLRAAIFEVLVTHQPEHQRLELVIHWQGGVHTKLHVRKRATPVGSKTDPSLVELVRGLTLLSDAEIARVLNMKKEPTPRGMQWNQTP